MVKNLRQTSAGVPTTNFLAAANRFVVGLPLLVSLLFAFGYLHVQSASQQRSLAAARAQHLHSSPSQPVLLLVTQPASPVLRVNPGSSDPALAGAGPAEPTVGPSPTDASSKLQANGQAKGNNGNDQLQATRKTLKLDELSL